MIEIDDLTFAYPNQPHLFQGFDRRALAHESWAIIGPSGCGKSTLLYLMAGLRIPSSGTIHVDREQIQRPRPRTGLILQDYGLLPWATVTENVALGLRVRRFYGPDGRHAPEDRQVRAESIPLTVSFWLERLGIAELRHQYPAQISGGQRQRTAIARTLALAPDLLLMDEPFSSLDTLTREDLETLTLELRQETGLTTVVVTHNIEEAVFMGQRLLLLRKPPHKEPLIVDNWEADHPSYRQQALFQVRCNQIRALLQESESPVPGQEHAQA